MYTSAAMRAAAKGERAAALVLKNGFVVNVFTDEIIEADVAIQDGLIVGVGDYEGDFELDCSNMFLIPGLIDAHMHIESTMLTPLGLSRIVLPRGTTTLIADPHEIVNVSGAAGLGYMLGACEEAPVNIHVMAPSSVPATPFDTNGAGSFDAAALRRFARDKRVLGLGEMMNFREVIDGDAESEAKLRLFEGKPIDGHAPGITWLETQYYRLAGVETEHEVSTYEDALAKLRAGFHLHIREGSGAKNLEPIVKGMLANGIPFDCCSFCTDDIHVEDIVSGGHMTRCVNLAIRLGMQPIDAIKCATINTALVYGPKDIGAISAGMRADIIVASDIMDIQPAMVFKDGKAVTPDFFKPYKEVKVPRELRRSVKLGELTSERIALRADGESHVIGLVPDTLLTEHLMRKLPEKAGCFAPDAEFNKLVVAERHGVNGNVAVSALAGYGLERGAVAASVSHDAHNVVAAGVSDGDIILACERLAELEGGYVVVADGEIKAELALPVAGLMTTESEAAVRRKTRELVEAARALGVRKGVDPLITLSFLALPVIPSLRLLDTGLFDVDKYEFVGS